MKIGCIYPRRASALRVRAVCDTVPYPIQFGKGGSNPMPSYTSRAQDAAQKIKEATIEVEAADRSYRKGGSLGALNKANRALADANDALYTADSGTMPDDRGKR
jgi:hypothetical protein